MIYFWIGIAFLLLLALGFILYPLFSQPESTQLNHTAHHKHHFILLIILASAIPVSALLIYKHFGDSEQLAKYESQQKNSVIVKKFMQEFKSPQQVIERMLAELKQHPESARGWYLLGRLYASQVQYKQARAAFAKAYKLKSSDSDIQLQYAQAIFFTEKQLLSDQAKALLNEVLKEKPNHPVALNLYALSAFHQHDYQQAISYWERMLKLFPAQSQANKIILRAIARAEKAAATDTNNNAPTQGSKA